MKITQAGQDAMADARTNGLLLDIVEFRLGDAYGYTPVLADTDLHGTVVYPISPATAVPTNFHRVHQPDGGNILTLSLVLGSTVGDFTFGEIALYISSDSGLTLFSLAALDSPISKTAASGSGEGSSMELKVKLPLGTGEPVINLAPFVTEAASLGTEGSFELLTDPSASPYNTVRSELKDEFNRAPVAIEADEDTWYSPQFDDLIASGAVESSTRYNLVDSSLQPYFSAGTPIVIAGRYIIQFTSGPLQGRIRHIIPTPPFVASQFLEVGALIAPTTPNGLIYIVTVSGTTGSEPVWPPFSTVTSGSVTFAVFGPDNSSSLCWETSTGTAPAAGVTYNLYRASSFTNLPRYIEEWMLKTRAVRFFSHHH
jgi:hypothetical protein